jgi:inhibitor of cysteine peptidase
MKLSENDSGKTVEIAIGDVLDVILPANPTTGYVWEVSSIDSSILQSNTADFVANDPAIGAESFEIIKFHTLAVGKSELKLILHRPFEQTTPPLKTFAVTVIIKK